MTIEERVRDLTARLGISAFEGGIAEALKERLIPYCEEVTVDRFHNVIGYKKSKRADAKTVLLEAHLDQIGLMVSKIEEDGFVRFANLGGVDERILPGAEVYLIGRTQKLYGVIGALPPHLRSGEEEGKAAKIGDMLIDTGLSKEELEKEISIGSCIQLKAECKHLLDGKISAPAMDNRAGVAALLDCLGKISEDCPYHVAVLFASQEELGLRGAHTGTAQIMPDMAIVVDVTHGATPETEKETGVFPLGSGVAICRGPSVHGERTMEIIRTAQEHRIPYTIEAIGGASGTDAWVIQTMQTGIPVVLLSIPLRYMHTTVETLAEADIARVSELIALALNGGAFHA